MKNSLLLLLFLQMTLCAYSKEFVLEPVLLINADPSELQVIPNNQPEILRYEITSYQVTFQNTSFQVGINRLNLRGIEEVKQMLLGEIQMSIDTKVIQDYFYKDFLILRLQASFFDDLGPKLRIFEIAMNYSNEKFLVALSRDVFNSEEPSTTLHALIDKTKLISIAEMDAKLGLPLSETNYNSLYEEASRNGDYASIYILQRKFQDQFSFKKYFQLIDSYESGEYNLADVLDLYLNSKLANTKLATLFRIQTGQPAPYLIETYLPLVRDRFIQIINSDVLPDSLFAYDFALLSENDRTFEITYSSAGEEDFKSMIVGFDYTKKGWQQQRVELPPSIAAVDPSGQSWQFTLLDPEFTTIYAKKELAYYFKPKYAPQEAWMKIPILPTDTSKFVFIEVGAKINTDYLSFESIETKIFHSSIKNISSSKSIMERLKEDQLTFTCPNNSSSEVIRFNDLCAETYRWKEYVRKYGSPNERAYCSPLIKEDLNNDGQFEFFTYVISNGKVVAFNGLETKNGKVISLSKEKALPLLKNNRAFNNLVLYSQMQ